MLKKRILAVLLCLCLTAGLCAPAYGAEEVPEPETAGEVKPTREDADGLDVYALEAPAPGARSGSVAYAVEGGNIYFDPETGEITGGDRSITRADIPESINGVRVTGIGGFMLCDNLRSVTIPGSVTSIKGDSFRHCGSLTSLTISEGVNSIGKLAFFGCGLTSVTIPGSVISIGDGAFDGCSKLTGIVVDSANGQYVSVDGVLFNEEETEIFCYPAGKNAVYYSIPNSVTSIGKCAFGYCAGLTSVTIPDSVTSIGESAFSFCTGLRSVTIPGSVTSIGKYAFSYSTELTSMTVPDSVTSIGDHAFEGCYGLTSVTIPGSVTCIEGYTFEGCYGLTSVTIPNSVTSIGDSAFEGCGGLTSVTIPNSVTSIGKWAFQNCSGLTDVYYTGSKEQWNSISISDYNSPLESATIHYNSAGQDAYVTVVGEKRTFNGHTYQLVYSTYGWNEMKSYCESQGGYLACITTTEEDAFLYNYINEYDVRNAVFGFTDDGDEGNWRWVSGEPVNYTNWYPGEANNENNKENWGHYYEKYLNGKWNDCAYPGNCHYLIEWNNSAGPGQETPAVTPENFQQDIYRADLMVNRDGTAPYTEIHNRLNEKSPSRVIQEELAADMDLLNAANAWKAVCAGLDAAGKPSSLYDLALEEKDFYAALLLDILEASGGDTQTSMAENVMNTLQSWLGEATDIIKIKYDVEHLGDLTDKEKEIIANAYEVLLNERVEFETWDTNHAFLGFMDTVFGYYSIAMDAAGDIKDFANHVAAACALSVTSESAKAVVQELYDNCPEESRAMKLALREIRKGMDTAEEELLAKISANTLKVAGIKGASKLVDEFWSETVLNCAPGVKIVLSAGKASKWAADQLFGASTITMETFHTVMTTEFERLMISTVRSLGGKFSETPNLSSAAAYLKAVDFYYSELDKSSEQGIAFVDAVESGLLKKLGKLFNSAGAQEREDIRKSIQSMQKTYKIGKMSLWNGWIYSLDDDFPDSGLYEKYCPLLIAPHELFAPVRKTVTAFSSGGGGGNMGGRSAARAQARPVNVLVYDAGGTLAAYVRDGRVHCQDDAELTLTVEDGRVELAFYEGAEYRVEYEGLDEGAVDIAVTEYGSEGESLREVYFQDLPLRAGTVYQAEIDDKTLDGADYALTSNDGERLDASLDTHRPPTEKYVLTVVSGAARTDGGSVFRAELYAGQKVEAMAYIPDGCTFTGWTANVPENIFSSAEGETTTVTMPARDVVIQATIAETGYSVILDPNGGTCDAEAVATELNGRLAELPVPVRPGYTFQGWFTALEEGSKITTPTVLTKNTTVYAHWAEEVIPAITALTAVTAGEKTTVAFSIPAELSSHEVSVTAARFNQGKMIDVAMSRILPDTASAVFSKKIEKSAGWTFFFLDAATQKPLCKKFVFE